MTTNQLSLAQARANIGIVPLILAAIQTILLYLTTSSLPVVETVYGCNFFCATATHLVTIIAAVLGAVTFALPAVIGLFSRTWRSALVLAVLPWWIAVIAHAGTLLTPYIGLGGNAQGGRFDAPFWLSAAHLPLLLASLALFAALGIFGWLARRVLAGE
ncbi:MAG TPA: hypothetical protein VFW17_05390 [Ktedonobacterales bacterium]|nr:hypothetical protein [Ktedonobacterales bacterium]